MNHILITSGVKQSSPTAKIDPRCRKYQLDAIPHAPLILHHYMYYAAGSPSQTPPGDADDRKCKIMSCDD